MNIIKFPKRVTRTIYFSVPVTTYAGALRKEMFEYVLLQFANELLIVKFFTAEFPPLQNNILCSLYEAGG
jgi:hypothetical protein